MITLAAIDIGSNAMRLAVGRFNSRGRMEVIHTAREPVRLGQEVFRNRQLSAPLIEQAVTAFLKFEQIVKQFKVSAVRAVGTSALRDASNSGVLIDRVRRATGCSIEIISGDEEARLIHLAVDHAVDLSRGVSLLLDIGGGSVEISVVNRGDIVFSDSLQMGTVRLLEMMRGRRRTPQVIERLVREYAGGIRRQVKRGISSKGVSRVIGTGGNIETFRNLRKLLLKKNDSMSMSRVELEKIYDVLRRFPLAERIQKLKLRPDRADVIIPAGALLSSVMRESSAKRLVVPGVGLREGLLYDIFSDTRDVGEMEPLQRRSKQLSVYAREFGKRFGFDEKHALHVEKISGQLFDLTRPLHRLDQETRVLLSIAAILHDIGHFVNGADHHKHTYYIVKESPFLGLSAEQKHLVAIIARYHRGSHPSQEHSEWRNLPAYDRRVVMVCGGILRLAEDLDREHLSRVRKVILKRSKDALELRMEGTGQLLVEKWGAVQKKGLLELALGVEIRVK